MSDRICSLQGFIESEYWKDRDDKNNVSFALIKAQREALAGALQDREICSHAYESMSFDLDGIEYWYRNDHRPIPR